MLRKSANSRLQSFHYKSLPDRKSGVEPVWKQRMFKTMERVRRALGERIFVLVIWTRWLRASSVFVCAYGASVCVDAVCVKACVVACVCVFPGVTVFFFFFGGGRVGCEHWYVEWTCVCFVALRRSANSCWR